MKIDWVPVKAAVETAGRKLMKWDLDDAVDLVRLAVDKWLDEDVQLLHHPAFEASFRQEVVPGVIVKGILDVFAERGGGSLLGGRDSHVVPCVIDWKTRQTADVDSDWARDLKDSAQWRIYAWASRAPIFIYRGISRRSRKAREVVIEVEPGNDAWVSNYLRGVATQHTALVTAALPVWPQVKPRSCRAFGRDCEYKQDCRAGGAALKPDPLLGSRDLSYTSIERFHLCPERYRRHALAPEGEYESDDSLFGQTFHVGVAEAWRQAFREED